ncbi:GNAT family N-acetyltransferase [Actinacidiphila rubida]|uniref:Acetyltransferase (GNAT) family protein n=1 Tax=Actinacidiphila rubida TaxID=310780 RepID=A0A1H8P893_9ACTN|nr:GNAT family N-acetyltransferase [Actinacidiphila rubida]SEO37848.1 Acetyltransferase (GNAT) family protein [Actinacidiphila rubida]
MRYEIRQVEPAEWRQSRALRLAALQDPVAAVAFARTYAEELAMSDEEWRGRASGDRARQFVAVRVDGADDGGGDGAGPDAWVGMAVVIAERPDYLSVNAVYVRPEVRGSGVAEKLLAAAIAWTWDRADQLYLWVHEKNPRAQAFYRRLGFVPTGESMASPLDPSMTESELVLTRGSRASLS